MSNLQDLYNQALEHRAEHKCGGYPYDSYSKLMEYVAEFKPHKILELGTGIGFSAAAMAKAGPESIIDTIEKDAGHVTLAKANLVEYPNVNILEGLAIETMQQLIPASYQLIFFDGFTPHMDFLNEFEKLIAPNGYLITANAHLKGRTSDEYLRRLIHEWEFVEQFTDTLIYKWK